RAGKPWRGQEAGQPLGLFLVERDRALGHALSVPDAEADVRILGQVARDAQRLAFVTRVGAKELDQLAPLRRRAPGAKAERRRQLPTALGADAHQQPPLVRNRTPNEGFESTTRKVRRLAREPPSRAARTASCNFGRDSHTESENALQGTAQS